MYHEDLSFRQSLNREAEARMKEANDKAEERLTKANDKAEERMNETLKEFGIKIGQNKKEIEVFIESFHMITELGKDHGCDRNVSP